MEHKDSSLSPPTPVIRIYPERVHILTYIVSEPFECFLSENECIWMTSHLVASEDNFQILDNHNLPNTKNYVSPSTTEIFTKVGHPMTKQSPSFTVFI